ncbi:MAG: hypothetical protein RL141_577 [Candidatus Parcubacteria bacterium]|jgi:hypothetical protein
MKTVLIISLILNVGFLLLANFFGQEMRNKFRRDYQRVVDGGIGVTYAYLGAEAAGMKTGMYRFTLRSTDPFTAAIGFRFGFPLIGAEDMINVYGHYRSARLVDGVYTMVIDTFLGKSPVHFVFVTNNPRASVGAITVTLGGITKEVPDGVYPPHWFQKFDFFS